jgi:hypothetical protein
MELIRKIILAVEDHPSGWAPDDMRFDGYEPEQIGYHCYLIVASGLAEGCDIATLSEPGPVYSLNHLTPAGHDFAENSRNEFIWNEVREEMRKKGVASAALDVVKRMLDKQIRKRLEAD